jgi:hypothetical protein
MRTMEYCQHKVKYSGCVGINYLVMIFSTGIDFVQDDEEKMAMA